MIEFFTIQQSANYLGYTHQVIRRLIKDKELPAYKISGQWRIKREELEEWLIQQKNTKD